MRKYHRYRHQQWFLILVGISFKGGDCGAAPTTTTTTTTTGTATARPSLSWNDTWISTWIPECESQLALFDVDNDGSLQPTELEKFLQDILPGTLHSCGTDTDADSNSDADANANVIAILGQVQETIKDVCGSSCRFQYVEQSFCTVLANAIQTHCGNGNGNSSSNSSTTSIIPLPISPENNPTDGHTFYFQYVVEFAIPSMTGSSSTSSSSSYTLLDRQQWLDDAMDQVVKTTWQTVLAKAHHNRLLRGTILWQPWTLQNGTQNMSFMQDNSLQLSPTGSHIVQFLPMDCNDCWNVTHVISIQNQTTITTTTTTTTTTVLFQTFRRRLQAQLPSALFTTIRLPPGVTVRGEEPTEWPQTVTTIPPSNTGNKNTSSPTLEWTRAPTTEAPTTKADTPIPSQMEGLQSWAIVLISAAGAVCSAIIYLWCFHFNHSGQTVAALPEHQNNTPDREPNQAQPPKTNNHGSIPPIHTNTNTNTNTTTPAPNTPGKNTRKSSLAHPPTNHNRTEERQHSHRNQQRQQQQQQPQQLEEEKVEEQAPILSTSSSEKRASSNARNAAYIDAAGRIIPVSFRSDRDSCLHVFEDASEAYSNRWSSSSTSDSVLHHNDAEAKTTFAVVETHNINQHQHQHDLNNGPHPTITTTTTTTNVPPRVLRVVSDGSSDSNSHGPETAMDEAPYYGGVYYGEDVDIDENENDINNIDSSHSQPIHDILVDPEVPVYGGVYYGSDEEPPKDSKIGINPPPMESFSGIRIHRNPSTSSISTLTKDGMLDGGEEWSLDSRRSKESSQISAEEREWQRRLREELLHPVTEDAAIADTTIVNLSGFTNAAGERGKRNRRRNKS